MGRLVSFIRTECRKICRSGDLQTASVRAIFLVAVVLTALIALLMHQRSVDQATEIRLERSLAVQRDLRQAFSDVQDVEGAARGFTITRSLEILAPYRQALAVLPGHMRALESRASESGETDYYRRFERAVAYRLWTARQVISLAQSGDPSRVEARARVIQAQVAMNRLRAVVADWEAAERSRYARQSAAAQGSRRLLSALMATLLAGMVLLLIAVSRAVVLTLRESRRAHEVLRRARDEAEAANKAKSTFLAMMSHELRTPLNGVLGMAHALDRTALSPAQHEYVQVISESGRSLLVILNDVLDHAKIESGKLELESVVFEPAALVSGVVDLWRASAAAKGLDLSLETSGLPSFVSGDPNRLRQVLNNLTSNALKFTERGGVRLSVNYDAPDRLSFVVSDTGPGVPPDLRDGLFGDFRQGDPSVARRYGGTGLGLAISRRLCRQMGGDLALMQAAVGAAFAGEVRLPRATAPDPVVAPEAPAEADCLLRVLAVDDNASNRAVAAVILKAAGALVTTASDGAQALEVLSRERFDVVLMDISMPVMDGVSALHAIRAGRAGDAAVPVIALTAHAMAGDRERYLAEGFDEYLPKPIQPEALIQALFRAVEHRLAAAA